MRGHVRVAAMGGGCGVVDVGGEVREVLRGHAVTVRQDGARIVARSVPGVAAECPREPRRRLEPAVVRHPPRRPPLGHEAGSPRQPRVQMPRGRPVPGLGAETTFEGAGTHPDAGG